MVDDVEPIEQPRAFRVTPLALMAYAIAIVVVALDQLSKYWVLQVLDLPHRPPIKVLPFFHLSFVDNPGVSFGLLRADTPAGRWILVLFALVFIAVLAVLAWRAASARMAVILGLVLGGALGNNLIDRVRLGSVTDFLDFHPIFPWVFNVADSAITIGVALYLLDSFIRPKDGATT